MGRKVIWSFFLVGACLLALKCAVDLCLPYRTSAILPFLRAHDNMVCAVLSGWDDSARATRYRVSEGLLSISSTLEKEVLEPEKVGYGDIILFWQYPKILPLNLESVPASSGANLKAAIFWLLSSLFVAIIWHYIAALSSTVSLSPKEKKTRPPSPEYTQMATLMGKSNDRLRTVADFKKDGR